MCGIAGYSCFGADYDPRLNLVITLLALQMETRGRQSWGWTDGQQIVKTTGSISDGFNASFHGGYLQATLHTRHATHGGITKENSHPFKVGNILGVHNGIIRNHSELNKEYDRKFDVDSMHIFAHIDSGLDLGELEGYGAVVFWKEGIIHLGRFNNGDLTIAKTENAWIWASTHSALKQTLRLAGYSKGIVYFKLKEGRCYKINGDKLERSSEIKLNFGHYDRKKHGSWEDGNKSTQTTSGGSTITGGYGNSDYGGNQYRGNGLWCNGRWMPWDEWRKEQDRLDAEKRGNSQTPPPSTVSGGGEQSKGGSVVNISDRRRFQGSETANGQSNAAGSVERTKKPERMSVHEQIEELISAALTAKQVEEKVFDWKCIGCKREIRGLYFATASLDLACDECATAEKLDSKRFEVLAGPFTTLPDEIMKVGSFFNEEELKNMSSKPTMECEGGCNKVLGPDDYFILTQDKSYICVNCFTNGAGEKDGSVVITTIDDDEGSEYVDEFQERENRQLNKMMNDAIAADDQSKREAENLYRYGVGLGLPN